MRDGGDILAKVRDSRIEKILRAARTAGSSREESVYLVGGCSRDLLRNAPFADVDLVVEGDAAGLARDLARRTGGRVIAASLFETCLVEAPGGIRVDVAMSRREVYRAPAALPVIYPAPIQEDLLRRDFTVNSMAVSLNGPLRGSLLDPSGGARDLRRRLLRLHHARSLADDPTRAFRGARYASRLRLRAAAGWRPAIRLAERARAFKKLSSARLRREIELIGMEPDPAAVVALCEKWGLLRKIDPRLRSTPALIAALRRGRRAAAADEDEALPPSEVFVALLAWSLPPRRRKILCARLGIAGDKARRIAEAAAAASRAERLFSVRGARTPSERVRRAREVADWTPLAVMTAAAACGGRVKESLRRERALWERARPKLKGNRIVDLGVSRGPKIAAILRALRMARYLGAARTSRDEVDLARSWIRKKKLP